MTSSLHDWTPGTRKVGGIGGGEERDPYYWRSGDYTVCLIRTKARGEFWEAWRVRERLGEAPDRRGAQAIAEADADRRG